MPQEKSQRMPDRDPTIWIPSGPASMIGDKIDFNLARFAESGSMPDRVMSTEEKFYPSPATFM